MEYKKLGEVCKIVYGKGLPTKELKVEGFPVFGANGIIGFNDKYLYEEPQVLISCRGAYSGKINFSPSKSFVTNNSLVLEIKDQEQLDKKFLFHILHSVNKSKLVTGTAQPQVTINNAVELEFPLPPKNIQQQIVSKIEELFSELDKGIEELKTAQQQLKVYRQAVLKWAFEGKLTNEDVKDGELPDGWEWKQLKEITSLLGDGLHGTPKYSENGEYYFINGNNLSDGKIIFKESTKRVAFEEYEKHKKKLNEKTVFVSINGTLGNTAFYNNEKIILGKSACYFNLNEEADKRYIRYVLTSQRFSNYAIRTATGSTIPNVSLKAMREFEIPLPSVEKQQQVVQEIESRLSVCDKIEGTITDSLKQAEALRQSILKKAFEGKIV